MIFAFAYIFIECRVTFSVSKLKKKRKYKTNYSQGIRFVALSRSKTIPWLKMRFSAAQQVESGSRETYNSFFEGSMLLLSYYMNNSTGTFSITNKNICISWLRHEVSITVYIGSLLYSPLLGFRRSGVDISRSL